MALVLRLFLAETCQVPIREDWRFRHNEKIKKY